MVDPGTAIESLRDAGLSAGGAAVTWRVFGPSIAAFGSNLGKWTDRWTANFLRVAERAEEKLGAAAEEPGEVPPRIIQRLVTDGAWCDDAVAQDYFAGLIAGSRSPSGEDDSNLPVITLLSRLGSRDIRAHYIFYSAIRHGLAGGWKVGSSVGRDAAVIAIPMEEFARGMDLSLPEAVAVAPTVIVTLAREGLLENRWASGPAEGLKEVVHGRAWEPPTLGLVVWPSYAGIELAIKADGPGDLSTTDFLYGVGWDEVEDVPVPSEGCVFPSAPTTWEDLQTKREAWGSQEWGLDPGWALPRPPEAA